MKQQTLNHFCIADLELSISGINKDNFVSSAVKTISYSYPI